MSGASIGLSLDLALKWRRGGLLGFSQLTGLQLFDHRGWPDVYPEHTLTAYAASLTNGAKFVECDVHLLSDGTLGVMHDSTVDRTTTSTGAPITFSEAQWKAMVCDPSTYLGANWPNDVPAFLPDVLDLYAGKVLLLLEPQTNATAGALLTYLNNLGIKKDHVMINSFVASRLTGFRSAGYLTYLNYSTYTGTPSTEVDEGILFDHTLNDPSVITSLQAEGLKASVYTIDNYYQKRRFAAADSIWTDQGGYLRGTTRRTTDPFSDQIYYHGHIACNGNGSFDGRGDFSGTDEWGVSCSSFSDWRGAVAGWANPLNGVDTTDGTSTVDSVVIDFEVKFTAVSNSNRFAWMNIGTTDDPMATDANIFGSGSAFDSSGYNFVCRQNGEVAIWRITDGELDAGTVPLVSTAGTTIAIGSPATYRITVTATNLKLERLDVATSCNVDNSDFRGGFLHHGFKGAAGTFRDISITYPI